MLEHSKRQTPERHYEELCQKGMNLIESRSSREALTYLKEALNLKINSPMAHHYQGLALHRLGCYGEALSSYDQALEIDSTCHEVWSDRGYTLHIWGRHEEALVSYYKALEIKPDSLDVLKRRKILLAEYQKTRYPLASLELKLDHCCAHVDPDAQRQLDQCSAEIAFLTGDPEGDAFLVDTTLLRQCFIRSDALLKLGRYEDAVSSYKTSLDMVKAYRVGCEFRGIIPKALYNCGVALYKLQELENAIARFNEALNKHTTYPLAFYGRALSLEKLGRIEEAITNLEKSLEISPCYSAAWYMKGSFLEQMGRFQEANRCFEKALDSSRAFENQEIERLVIDHLGRSKGS